MRARVRPEHRSKQEVDEYKKFGSLGRRRVRRGRFSPPPRGMLGVLFVFDVSRRWKETTSKVLLKDTSKV